MSTRETIIEILKKYDLTDEEILSSDYEKLDILDSLIISDIVFSIEDKYGFEVDGEDISPDNFKNLDAICNLVEKYRG